MSDRMSELHDEFNPKRLDVLAAAAEAYRGAWMHLNEMVRIIWLPGLLYISLSVVAALVDMRNRTVLPVLLEIGTLFLWPIIAVAWHRFILMGETEPGRFHLQFGRREGRYLLVSFLLVLIFMPGFLIAMATVASSGGTTGPTSSLIGFLGLLLLFVGIYYFIRLSLLLPAVAVDDPVNARLVIERTRYNFWRIVALFVLAGLPFFVFFWLVGMLADAAGLPVIVPFIIYAFAYIFFAIVDVAILSIAYRELIGPPGAAAAEIDRPDTP